MACRRGLIPHPGASGRRERGSGNARNDWGGGCSENSRARHKVPEGEWEGMRADMYSTIIAAFRAAPAKHGGVCDSREESQRH